MFVCSEVSRARGAVDPRRAGGAPPATHDYLLSLIFSRLRHNKARRGNSLAHARHVCCVLFHAQGVAGRPPGSAPPKSFLYKLVAHAWEARHAPPTHEPTQISLIFEISALILY